MATQNLYALKHFMLANGEWLSKNLPNSKYNEVGT